MRLTLDAPGSALTLDDDGATVRGVAVPYGETGLTSAGLVRFARGSLPLDLADRDAPVPLLLDHDLTRPIGVVVELGEDIDRLTFTGRLDPIPAAEHARAQMRSRSRPGVSVGVDVLDYTIDDDGAMVVTAAEWVELSSVVRPAFAPAQIAAALAHHREEQPVTETTTDAAPADVTAASKSKPDEADTAPARVPGNVTVAPARQVPPTVRAFAAQLTRALRGADLTSSRDMRMVIEQVERASLTAALVDVTTAEWPPPGSYMAELDNLVRFGMPTVDAFTVVPTSRWPVKQRQVKTWPTAGKQSAEKAQIPSTAAATEWANIDDATYAHGNDVSLQDVEDNGEQVISDLLELTAEVVGNQINGDALAAINTAAQSGGTGISLDNIGAALGAVAGSGYGAPVIVCAPDVFGTLWSLTAGGGPALARLGGLDVTPTVVPDNMVTAGTMYVGARRAFKTYISAEARLRAVEVSLLGLDVGLYRRAAFRVVDANALVKITAA